MSTLTITLWFLSISLAACFGYVLGAIMASGARADEEMEKQPRKRRRSVISSRGKRSKPELVMISPTEMRAVKS